MQKKKMWKTMKETWIYSRNQAHDRWGLEESEESLRLQTPHGRLLRLDGLVYFHSAQNEEGQGTPEETAAECNQPTAGFF